MKKLALILVLPGAVLAAEPQQTYSFGVSGQVVSNESETVTDLSLIHI